MYKKLVLVFFINGLLHIVFAEKLNLLGIPTQNLTITSHLGETNPEINEVSLEGKNLTKRHFLLNDNENGSSDSFDTPTQYMQPEVLGPNNYQQELKGESFSRYKSGYDILQKPFIFPYVSRTRNFNEDGQPGTTNKQKSANTYSKSAARSGGSGSYELSSPDPNVPYYDKTVIYVVEDSKGEGERDKQNKDDIVASMHLSPGFPLAQGLSNPGFPGGPYPIAIPVILNPTLPFRGPPPMFPIPAVPPPPPGPPAMFPVPSGPPPMLPVPSGPPSMLPVPSSPPPTLPVPSGPPSMLPVPSGPPPTLPAVPPPPRFPTPPSSRSLAPSSCRHHSCSSSSSSNPCICDKDIVINLNTQCPPCFEEKPSFGQKFAFSPRTRARTAHTHSLPFSTQGVVTSDTLLSSPYFYDNC